MGASLVASRANRDPNKCRLGRHLFVLRNPLLLAITWTRQTAIRKLRLHPFPKPRQNRDRSPQEGCKLLWPAPKCPNGGANWFILDLLLTSPFRPAISIYLQERYPERAGREFSHLERQLLCVVRHLLRCSAASFQGFPILAIRCVLL